MKKILLDTSVVIDFLRSRDKGSTLLYKLSTEDLYISIISHTELFAGKSIWETKEIRDKVVAFFTGLTILPLSEDISEKAGFIRAYQQKNSLIDSIIAATAIINQYELATLNKKDFEKIEGISLSSL